MKTPQLFFATDLKGPPFLRRVVSAVNTIGRALNGLSYDGGDIIVAKDGIFLRPKASPIAYEDHPWQLYQKPANDPGLTVSMIPGIVTGINAANSNPLNSIVSFADTAFPDDATTLVWVRVSIELIVWTPYFKVWAVSAAVVQTGASLPTDTLDISTQTDGDVHVQIGSVTTASGAVTGIVQTLFTPLVYDLPPILYGPDTGDYVLTSEDSVIGWTELGPFACPEA